MSTPKFVSSILLRICDPDPSSHGLDFSNFCVVMNSLPAMAWYGERVGGAKTLKLLHFKSIYTWVGQKLLNWSSLANFHVSNA